MSKQNVRQTLRVHTVHKEAATLVISSCHSFHGIFFSHLKENKHLYLFISTYAGNWVPVSSLSEKGVRVSLSQSHVSENCPNLKQFVNTSQAGHETISGKAADLLG